MRYIIGLIFWVSCTTFASAAPVVYLLDKANSKSEFTYEFENNPVTGTLPITDAEILLDLQNIANSKVTTRLNASKITAGFVFATQALRGKEMLDVARHPTITFRSTAISGTPSKGIITGRLTLHGITKTIRLTAQLFRPNGAASTDTSTLIIALKGQINRNDFGVNGYPALVGPMLDLNIRAQVTRR